MRKMRRYKDHDHGAQPAPHVIDRFRVDSDPKGAIASFQPNGATFTSNNAFFKDMGTNGRTCFTCHQPQNAWGVSARDVAERFERTAGTDPIFRLVDGATCPSDDVSTLRAKKRAYKLLTEKGLIRVGLAIPAAAEFAVTAIDDPWLQHQSRDGLRHSVDVQAPVADHQCGISKHRDVGRAREHRAGSRRGS